MLEPRQPDPLPSRYASGRRTRPEGLHFGVASSIHEVVTAWRLVYSAYRQTGLINPNIHRVFTFPALMGHNTLVISGAISGVTVSTLSTALDPAICGQLDSRLVRPLPIADVFGAELAQLRASGARVMELALFADRRVHLARAVEAMIELARIAFGFAQVHDVTDLVIAVPETNAPFYSRYFGFVPWTNGLARVPGLNRPVVGLRCPLSQLRHQQSEHPILRYFLADPVPPETFARRLLLQPGLSANPVDNYLNDLAELRRLSATG